MSEKTAMGTARASSRARSAGTCALAAGVAAVVLAVAGCGGGAGASGGGTVTVYSSLPLQGAARPQSQSQKIVNGIKLALDQAHGKAGQFNVKYASLDDATPQAGNWTPEAASANARKVSQDDSAVAYIGEFNDQRTSTAGQVHRATLSPSE